MDRARCRAIFTGALALGAAMLTLAGCGTAAGPPPGPRVSLQLSAPTADSRVSTASATVAGTVHPASARVAVLGQRVKVSANGSFSTQIGLTVGANLIDVEASAPRSAGAVSAVRVIRFLLVTVPQLGGKSPSQAASQLRALGLKPKIDSSSNPLNFLLPESTSVCSTSPGFGARIDPGATVTLHTSKLCGL